MYGISHICFSPLTGIKNELFLFTQVISEPAVYAELKLKEGKKLWNDTRVNVAILLAWTDFWDSLLYSTVSKIARAFNASALTSKMFD